MPPHHRCGSFIFAICIRCQLSLQVAVVVAQQDNDALISNTTRTRTTEKRTTEREILGNNGMMMVPPPIESTLVRLNECTRTCHAHLHGTTPLSFTNVSSYDSIKQKEDVVAILYLKPRHVLERSRASHQKCRDWNCRGCHLLHFHPDRCLYARWCRWIRCGGNHGKYTGFLTTAAGIVNGVIQLIQGILKHGPP